MTSLADDIVLLEAAQAGDRRALDDLLRRHRNGVYRYGLTVCTTTENTEDAVQLTLWAASRAIAGFRGAASLVTWLFTIVRNWCLRLERRERGHAGEAIDEPLADPGSSPEERADVRRAREALSRAISALPPMYREAIVLRDVEGKTAPEAAAELGVTVRALKTRLHRGRAQLRRHRALRELLSP